MRAGQLVSNCWKRQGAHGCNCLELGSASLHWVPGEHRRAGSQMTGQALGIGWRPGRQGDSRWWSQHPYPSEEQKKQLAQDTGLTILQVNNW